MGKNFTLNIQQRSAGKIFFFVINSPERLCISQTIKALPSRSVTEQRENVLEGRAGLFIEAISTSSNSPSWSA